MSKRERSKSPKRENYRERNWKDERNDGEKQSERNPRYSEREDRDSRSRYNNSRYDKDDYYSKSGYSNQRRQYDTKQTNVNTDFEEDYEEETPVIEKPEP